jgi:hypothetical protein
MAVEVKAAEAAAYDERAVVVSRVDTLRAQLDEAIKNDWLIGSRFWFRYQAQYEPHCH